MRRWGWRGIVCLLVGLRVIILRSRERGGWFVWCCDGMGWGLGTFLLLFGFFLELIACHHCTFD